MKTLATTALLLASLTSVDSYADSNLAAQSADVNQVTQAHIQQQSELVSTQVQQQLALDVYYALRAFKSPSLSQEQTLVAKTSAKAMAENGKDKNSRSE